MVAAPEDDAPPPGMEEQLAEEQRRVAWGAAADSYQATAELWTSQAAARLIGLAELTPRGELVDIGCGAGGLSIAAQTLGALVTAYDVAPSMIAAASERAGGRAVQFRIGEVRALPDRDGAFDTALANFSIVETGEPEKALKEAFRVLRPGGRLVWTCWPAPTGGALFEVVDAARLAVEGLGARAPVQRGLEVEAAIALTKKVGFDPVDAATLTLTGAAAAEDVLTAAEKLDVATPPPARSRAHILAALEEALKGAAELRSEAIMIVAEKPSAPRAPENAPPQAAETPATPEAPASRETGGDDFGGGLVGLFRRWMGRR